jgi:hypothetical protein
MYVHREIKKRLHRTAVLGTLLRLRRRAMRLGSRIAANTGSAVDWALNGVMATYPRQARGVVDAIGPVLADADDIAALKAVLIARSEGWAEVKRSLPGPAQTGRRLARAALIRETGRGAACRLALPKRDRAPTADPALAAQVTVYTVRFGETAPDPVFGAPEGVSFVCFVDRPMEVPGWRIIVVEPDARDEAFYRILPHRVLRDIAPDSDCSLYLAPDRMIVGNLNTLLERWLFDHDFVAWRRSGGGGWRALAERALVLGEADAAQIAAQAVACAEENTPRDSVVIDTGVLWRRHGRDAVAAAMDAWWALHEPLGGSCDLSFCRAASRAGAPSPAVMPVGLGDCADNIFFAKDWRAPSVLDGRQPSPAIKRRVPLTFLYAERYANQISTTLRGVQLSRIIAEHGADRYDVSYVSDAASVDSSIVIVTKSALMDMSPRAIRRLGGRNIALIGAWEDEAPHPDKAGLVDANMTLSTRMMLDLNRLYPKIPAFHVTHHVNTNIPASTPPMDRLRAGYFGELFNTVLPGSLDRDVKLVNTGAPGIGDSWMNSLAEYNCHWIVRNRHHVTGYKPFLKGFVAARCGAVVIVTRDDANAIHYLGDDYPFYAEGISSAELEDAWLRAATGFGGADWRLAQDIMKQVAARNTHAQVFAEFDAMVTAVAGGA